MKNRTAALGGFSVGVLSCILPSIGGCLLYPTARQALPFRAVNIREVEYINGFLPDFSYKLEADNITPEEFEGFVRRMRFPESSRQNARSYIIDDPKRQYHRRVEYQGQTLSYEEVRT